MKHLLSYISLGLLVLPLAGCVDLDPALLGGGGYGGGYNRPAPSPYYGGGYQKPYYDDHHSDHHNDDHNYYGGHHAWYDAGVGIGKKDRREHKSPNYRNHKSQYDGRTESEFARGYNDGYYH
jgi:hypothetical protein